MGFESCSPQGRKVALQELHEGHPGITRMKSLSRMYMYVWWPSISADIEKSVRLYHQYQEMQSTPPAAPLNPWKAHLHLDSAGLSKAKQFWLI